MSKQHPVVAVTGSSGAGTSTVKTAFEHIFRRLEVTAAIVEGDSYHRYSRNEMRAAVVEASKRGENISHFGPEANILCELAELFKQYGKDGTGKRRFYVHNEDEAVLRGVPSGEFTEWEDLPRETDMLLYEGLHGAMVLIPQPAEHIWKVMLDCERAPEFVPNMRRCEVVERADDGSWEVIEHEIKYRWFAPKTVYRFRAEYVPQQSVHFERVSGDLRHLEGDWGLFPLPVEADLVLVSYSVFIDPGVLIPDAIVRRALERDLPELMLALKNRVDEANSPSTSD